MDRSKKHSKIKLNTNPPLEWGTTEFDLLGLKFSVNLHDMIKLNYDKYLAQITETINHWNKRYLTPIGKITVIKTFILSKLIHLFTAIPNPPDNIIKNMNTQIFQFLWDKKPDKIKRQRITQPYHKVD